VSWTLDSGVWLVKVPSHPGQTRT